MQVTENFTRQFLIAMPNLADPNFFHSVTLICEHSEEGAMGLVINRPMDDVNLGVVLAHMGIEGGARLGSTPIYSGGPVQPERGFVLHSPPTEWNSTLRLGTDLAVTTSRDILEALAAGRGPEQFIVTLGYAGWGPGQLEQEIADNAWLTTPADKAILFDLPAARRWESAAKHLGIDLNLLSGEAGHA